RAPSFPSRSRTARARSASTGSSAASRAAASTAATPSRAATSERRIALAVERDGPVAAQDAGAVQAPAQRDIRARQEEERDAGRLGPLGVNQVRRRQADQTGQPEREDHVPRVLLDRLPAPMALVPGLQILELPERHGVHPVAGNVPGKSTRESTLRMSVWPQNAIVSSSSRAMISRVRVTPASPIAPSP